jgi:hypothetical protein
MVGVEELSKLSGISEASVLAEPPTYINPRAFRVPSSETAFYRYPHYSTSSNESELSIEPPESLVFLHRGGDSLFKKSSQTFCTPTLTPGGLGLIDSLTDTALSHEESLKTQIQLDDDGLESILVMPDENDPLTYYHERIRTLDTLNDKVQSKLQVDT